MSMRYKKDKILLYSVLIMLALAVFSHACLAAGEGEAGQKQDFNDVKFYEQTDPSQWIGSGDVKWDVVMQSTNWNNPQFFQQHSDKIPDEFYSKIPANLVGVIPPDKLKYEALVDAQKKSMSSDQVAENFEKIKDLNEVYSEANKDKVRDAINKKFDTRLTSFNLKSFSGAMNLKDGKLGSLLGGVTGSVKGLLSLGSLGKTKGSIDVNEEGEIIFSPDDENPSLELDEKAKDNFKINLGKDSKPVKVSITDDQGNKVEREVTSGDVGYKAGYLYIAAGNKAVINGYSIDASDAKDDVYIGDYTKANFVLFEGRKEIDPGLSIIFHGSFYSVITPEKISIRLTDSDEIASTVAYDGANTKIYALEGSITINNRIEVRDNGDVVQDKRFLGIKTGEKEISEEEITDYTLLTSKVIVKKEEGTGFKIYRRGETEAFVVPDFNKDGKITNQDLINSFYEEVGYFKDPDRKSKESYYSSQAYNLAMNKYGIDIDKILIGENGKFRNQEFTGVLTDAPTAIIADDWFGFVEGTQEWKEEDVAREKAAEGAGGIKRTSPEKLDLRDLFAPKDPVNLGVEGYVTEYPITSSFGNRKDPFTGKDQFHNGMDIGASKGIMVIPYSSGTVTYAGKRAGYGNIVEITHENGIITKYAHLSAINVKTNQQVTSDTSIGAVGSTGRSTNNHLHFEVEKDGKVVDPKPYYLERSLLYVKEPIVLAQK